MTERTALRTSILILTSALLVSATLYGGWAIFFSSNTSSAHFVDSVGGNDSNSGTQSSPWLTVTHADSVLANNATLYLKYPDGTWVLAPSIWHGLWGLYPAVKGSNAALFYDVANGHNCTFTNSPQWTWTGVLLRSAFSQYLNCGVVYGLGTSTNASILVNVSPIDWTGAQQSIFSAGTLSGNPGWGIYTNSSTLVSQIRTAGTFVNATSGALSGSGSPHTFAATFVRNSATGSVVYIDGVVSGSPADNTSVTGNITATINTLFGSRDDISGQFFYLDANYLSQTMIFNRALSSGEVSTLSSFNGSTGHQTSTGNYFGMGKSGIYTNTTFPLAYWSSDGTTFYQQKTSYTGSSTHFEEPSVLRIGSTLYMIFDDYNQFSTYFNLWLAKSTDGINWFQVVKLVDGSPATGTEPAGSGQLFQDNDLSIHTTTFSGFAASGTTDIWDGQPTVPSDLSQPWTFTKITPASAPSNCYSASRYHIGSTYYLFCTDGSGAMPTGYVWNFSSSSINGPYSLLNSGNWTGWGGAEGMLAVNTGGSNWTAYFNPDIPGSTPDDISYSTSTDNMATWSAKALVTIKPTTSIKAGLGVIKMP